MQTLQPILDFACQLAVLFLMLGAGWWLFQHAKSVPGQPNIFERWAAMKDDDQLMALAVFIMLLCLPMAVCVLLFVLVHKPLGYDTLIGSVITSLLGTGALGVTYFFTQGHAGKKAAASLAAIAAEPEEAP